MSNEGEGLVLDARSHRYSFDGEPVGGVTEIMTALGIINPRFFDDFSRERGTAVHSALHLLAVGDLDWESVDSRVAGFVRAGESFLRDVGALGNGPVMAEYLVYHPTLRYAGRIDLVAPVFDQMAVIDFKSGGLGCAGLQTAAYEEALRIEAKATKPLRRMAVQLRENGTYRKEDFTKASDFQDWAACCRIFNTYHKIRKERDHE